MAKKKVYESEIKIKDSFSKPLQQLTKGLKDVKKNIDDINKTQVKVGAKLDSSFKNAVNEIDRKIPKDKKINISANQDISRTLEAANRDIFEMNRRLQSNLDNSFRKMASNANKYTSQIKSATSSLGSLGSAGNSSISSNITSKLLGGSTSGKLGNGLTNALIGGNILATMGKKNKLGNKSSNTLGNTLSNELDIATESSKEFKKELKDAEAVANKLTEQVPSKINKVTKSIEGLGSSVKKIKKQSTFGGLTKATFDTFTSLPGDMSSGIAAFIKGSKVYDRLSTTKNNISSGLSSMTNNIAHGIGNRLPGNLGNLYRQNKVDGLTRNLSNSKILTITLKDYASAKLTKIKSGVTSLTSKAWSALIKAKDVAMPVIKKIGSGLKNIASKTWTAVVKVKDMASAALSKIGGMLKTMAKGITVGVGVAAAAGGYALKQGMTLENQKTSMAHFMDRLNPGGDTEGYINDLRNYANNTPFETGDVMAGGARALQVANGDTAYAQRLMQMAGDMAAANPDKTIGQALEALADANMGESARLVEFGVKMDSDTLKATGLDGLMAEDGALGKLYNGAADKLAQTSSGKWSTILGKGKSGISDIGLGLLDGINKSGAFDKAIDMMDKLFSPKNVETFVSKVTTGFGKMYGSIKDFSKKVFGDLTFEDFTSGLMNAFNRVKDFLGPIIDTIGDIIGRLAPYVMPVIDKVVTAIEGLQPVFTTIFEALEPVLMTFLDIFSKVAQFVIDNTDTITSIVQNLGDIWAAVWPTISGVLETAWAILEPILSTILSMINGVLDALNNGIKKLQEWGEYVEANKSQSNNPRINGTKAKTIGDRINEQKNSQANPYNRNANGLERVPYDGYFTELHEGEKVVTANNVRAGNGSKSMNNTFNITINSSGNEAYDADLLLNKLIDGLKYSI